MPAVFKDILPFSHLSHLSQIIEANNKFHQESEQEKVQDVLNI